MLQLTYISTQARNLPRSAVGDILSSSRRNNAAVGVTGLLLYNGRRFLQVLEGDSDAIEQTYVRIKQDPRHFAIVQLSRTEVTQPSFGNWSMAAELFGSFIDPKHIIEQVDKLTATVKDLNLREHLRSFSRLGHEELIS